ncbi:hypothetical protein [Amycolatopsis lexingtonensis]|uniref:hypothetical protein n=1 Tax=Amycolatopsis lexingtonensis TaxID=218822 RepID=UPI003F72C8DB
MQTTGDSARDAAADAAILSNERRIRARVLVDWNNDGLYTHALSDLSTYVSNAVTDRSLKGSAPEELMLVEGAAAAELTFTFAGQYKGMPMTAVFSPYNGNSPFYLKTLVGQEVKYDLGVDTVLGTVWYPQFVGNVRTTTPDRASNTVEVSALDRVEKLRRPITLPPWAISEYWISRGRTLAQLVTSTGVIDSCLRMCDTAAGKWRPTLREDMEVPDGSIDGPGVFVTGNGSYLPTIGWMDNTNAVTYDFPATEADGTPEYRPIGQPHPNAPDPTVRPQALTAMRGEIGNKKVYWVSDRTQTTTDGTHYMGFTLSLDPSDPNNNWYLTAPLTELLSCRIGHLNVIKIMLQAGQLWARISYGDQGDGVGTHYDSTKITIPSGVQTTDVFAVWEPSLTLQTKVAFRVGDTKIGWTNVAPVVPSTADDQLRGVVIVHHAVAMSDIGYSFRHIGGNTADPFEFSERWLHRQAKYAATLDPGLNRFSFMPNRDGSDAWDIITEVAAAEFGSVFWDEAGRFRFWNLDTILAKRNSPVRTVTLDHLSDLQITNSLDSVRNTYSATIGRRRAVDKGTGYEAQTADEFYLAPGQSKTFTFFLDDVQQFDPKRLTRFTSRSDWTQWWPLWTDASNQGYVMQYFKDGTWQEPFVDGGQDVTFHLDGQGNATVTIFNGWAQPTRFTTNDGTPALRVIGTKLTEVETATFTTTDRDSVLKYGSRNLELTGDWYQDYYNANGMLSKLLERTKQPIPTTDAMEIAGDPRLQLGDCVEATDPEGFGERMVLQIFGIRREFDVDTGLTDTLTVEAAQPTGVGLWDSPQYGRWDETFVWS